MAKPVNIDLDTVKGFGLEWSKFTQRELSEAERSELFQSYFSQIDWTNKPARALDMGCGSGRWDILVAPLVGDLVAADASPEALRVAQSNAKAPNISFVQATPDTLPFPDGHFDLIFALGVLDHVPDTAGAIRSLTEKLCAKGTLLLYLAYAFDNRPLWFRALWKVTDLVRCAVAALPFPLRYFASQCAAIFLYFPVARVAKYFPVPDSWPLKHYANRSFNVMRTDALDRFGTKVAKRFTRAQITEMHTSAGLTGIRFSEAAPHWVSAATKP